MATAAASGLLAGPFPVTLPVLDAKSVRKLATARAFVTIAKDGSRALGAPATPFVGRPVAAGESLEAALVAVAPPTEADLATAKAAAAAAKELMPSCHPRDDEWASGLAGPAKKPGEKPGRPDGKSGERAGKGGGVKLAVTPRVVGVLDEGDAADALVLADAASSAVRTVASIHALGGRGATIGVSGGGGAAAGAVSYRLTVATTHVWLLSQVWISFDGAALELQRGAAADPEKAEITKLPLVDGKIPHERLRDLLHPAPLSREHSVGAVLGGKVTTQQLVDLFGAITAAGARNVVLIAQPEGTLDPLPPGPTLWTLFVDGCP